MNNNNFHTFSESMKKDGNTLTASMEDYLEMIYRLSSSTGFTRIHELSDALNVQPSSATKMVQRLNDINILKYEKYGYIMLTEKGKIMGEVLLQRHNIIETFLRTLGISEYLVLTETEKIEHTLSSNTVKCFENFILFIDENPDIALRLSNYKSASE